MRSGIFWGFTVLSLLADCPEEMEERKRKLHGFKNYIRATVGIHSCVPLVSLQPLSSDSVNSSSTCAAVQVLACAGDLPKAGSCANSKSRATCYRSFHFLFNYPNITPIYCSTFHSLFHYPNIALIYWPEDTVVVSILFHYPYINPIYRSGFHSLFLINSI